MHKRILPSFFFTNRTGAPHGETLGWMKCLARSSSSWRFSSLSSIGDILYGVMETGAVPGTRSIENSASLSGGREVISSGKTSENSHTTGISDNSTLTEDSLERTKRKDLSREKR